MKKKKKKNLASLLLIGQFHVCIDLVSTGFQGLSSAFVSNATASTQPFAFTFTSLFLLN